MNNDVDIMEAFFKVPMPVYVRVFGKDEFNKFLSFIHDEPPKGRIDVETPEYGRVSISWTVPE